MRLVPLSGIGVGRRRVVAWKLLSIDRWPRTLLAMLTAPYIVTGTDLKRTSVLKKRFSGCLSWHKPSSVIMGGLMRRGGSELGDVLR